MSQPLTLLDQIDADLSVLGALFPALASIGVERTGITRRQNKLILGAVYNEEKRPVGRPPKKLGHSVLIKSAADKRTDCRKRPV